MIAIAILAWRSAWRSAVVSGDGDGPGQRHRPPAPAAGAALAPRCYKEGTPAAPRVFPRLPRPPTGTTWRVTK